MREEETIDKLNSMLRGELAATETYLQAIEKLGNGPAAADLRSIHDDHRRSANEFRKHVHDYGGKPDQKSGAWGTFAKAVTGAAKAFGETATLEALKEGEEQGVSSYEDALKNPDMPLECRTLVNATLSRCRSHVAALDKLIGEPKP